MMSRQRQIQPGHVFVLHSTGRTQTDSPTFAPQAACPSVFGETESTDARGAKSFSASCPPREGGGCLRSETPEMMAMRLEIARQVDAGTLDRESPLYRKWLELVRAEKTETQQTDGQGG